ncbi:YceI family protein [Pseudoduganella violaceinigra]|uniref:YceI family protein n=1 Tax=Pseudoduganella violaceinigra TaxID=246602 RepID=UPI00040EE4C3|nr:YceI family protein [Pseudoduganella violaceinigra]
MYRHIRRAAVCAVLLSAAAAQAAPVTYTIVSKLSKVSFSFEHQGFIPVSGTLKVAPGSFVFDNEDWSKSSVAVSMPTSMLDMGDGLWNGQIRGDDAWTALFKQPEIRFRSTRIERRDAMSGVLHGELTLAGMTRPVALQMKVNKIGVNRVSNKPSIGISATSTVKRSDFGLDAYMDLVGDAIAVQIQLEAAVGPDPDAGKEMQMNSVAQ